ncbi:MAG: NAD(P)-binding protein [Candidatus Nanoarchaeia archaeon]|nr:NAD(P)-binding protein [Candidatus Jingweiarchaeum tengchongense]
MSKNSFPEVTILGAGLSGLSFAYHYPGKSVIFEKLDTIGGTARTEEESRFFYDYGPHVSFTEEPYIIELLSKNIEVFENEAKPMNTYRGIEFPHPALFHLDKLPKEECYKILMDLIEAYKEYDKVFEVKNYEEWCEKNQGKYFAQNYTKKYTKKFWCTDPQFLTVDWVGNRVPSPSISDAIKGSIGLQNESGYYFQKYRYPKEKGFGNFSEFFRNKGKDINIFLNKEVIAIDTKNKVIEFKDGHSRKYEVLVSTIPIPEMSKIIFNLSDEIKEILFSLKYTSLHYINIAMKGEWKRDFSWLYFYDEDIPITRLIAFNKISSNMSPKGYTALQIEIPYIEHFDESLIDKSILAIKNLGYIDDSLIVNVSNKDLKYGYVIYDFKREKSVRRIIKEFENIGINSLGRYGTWSYLWSHQVILQGKKLAEEISKNADKP